MSVQSSAERVEISETGRAAVLRLADRVGRRSKGPLVRNSFVRRQPNQESATPLAVLARTRGRGAGVAIKVYLAVLWVSAKAPFDTTLSAQALAKVLDLEDPAGAGARRVRDALTKLDALKLIKKSNAPGEPTRIQLLREDGSGAKYNLPYATRPRRTSSGPRTEDYYFKVPPQLWTSGHIQNMSTSALVMLLILLEESRGKTEWQWWSMAAFSERFGISKDMRTRGTAELKTRGLVVTGRMSLEPSPGVVDPLATRRTRTKYKLAAAAAGIETE